MKAVQRNGGSNVLFVACLLWAAGTASPVNGQTVVFEGARLINGEGGAPIENAAFIVQGDRFTAVGRRGELAVPQEATHIDLTGKTVIPALVDAHVHMGYRKGLSFGQDNYTRENLTDILNRFAYYGVAAILEAGTARSDLAYQLRAEIPPGALFRTAGHGFGMPNAGPGGPMRDSAYGVTAEAEARMDVRELAAKKVDMIKIWVDDRNGTVEKLKPNLYRAIIDEAHKHDIHVLAHIVDLADAKDLLRAGVDGFAHMIRDKDIDDELLVLLKTRPNVFFQQTLWGERRAIYASKPAWLDEPLLRETLSSKEIELLGEEFSANPANPEAVQRARAMGQVNLRNTARLNAAGVTLALGTDTGGVSGGQYFGLGTHVEMEIQATRAGLTPMQALVAGTRTSARILRLDQLGTVAPGKSADFLVLNGNPLDNIANTRKINRVYLRGQEVPRTAMTAKWQAELARTPPTR
ncbi:MAG TPA: amidohydrolase family protein [Xanthobacteraceae bacterium]